MLYIIMYKNVQAKTFTITSQPFYNQFSQCYLNILTVNIEPQGPIRKLVKKIKFPKLSPFQIEGPCYKIEQCGLALRSLYNLNGCNDCDLMTPNEIPDLVTFLSSNGYQIETQITNMLNQNEIKLNNKKVVFNVTYYGTTQPNITYIR